METARMPRTTSMVGLSVLVFMVVGVPTALLLWWTRVVGFGNFSAQFPVFGTVLFLAFFVGSFTAALSGLLFGLMASLALNGAWGRSLLNKYWIGTGLALGAICGIAGFGVSMGWTVSSPMSVLLPFGLLPGAASGVACLWWCRRSLSTPNPTPHVDARDAEGNLDSPAARAGGRER